MVAFADERACCAQADEASETLRDAIAALDADIERLRADLIAFEDRFHQALAREHALEQRIASFVRHLERLEALATRAASRADARAQQTLVDERRRHEVVRWHAERMASLRDAHIEADGAAGATKAPAEAADRAQHAGDAKSLGDDASPDVAAAQRERSKVAYRLLARRYHPDLASGEAQRAVHSARMAHVNALYGRNDWQRLETLAAQANAPSVEERAAASGEPAAAWPERLAAARQRQGRFRAVLDALQDEHDELVASEVAALHEEVAQLARWSPRDPFAALRDAALARAREGLAQIPHAFAALENAVHASRLLTPSSAGRASSVPARRGDPSLPAAFDPHVGHAFCQLGLQALAARRTPAAAAALAAELAPLCTAEPAVMRLALFAYVAQLSPQPIEPLSTFAGLSARFAAACRRDGRVLPLSEALVQGDGLVAVRMDPASPAGYELRLCLRERRLVQAIPTLLRDVRARRLFSDVLAVLGDAMRCGACRSERFAVPLFWLRGLDTLRASVCPRCKAVLRRYVLARGDDVQALLNRTYLDFELVTEATFALGRRPIGLQMLSHQAATFTAGDASERLATDLFERNGLRVRASEVRVAHEGHLLPAATVLARLPSPSLRLALKGAYAGNEQALCDELAYRVRTRYRPQQA